MKQLLITIAAVVLVGCGESQQSTSPEAKPIERVGGAKAADISISYDLGSAIHDAAFDGNIEVVKQRLAAGVDVNLENDEKETPLFGAAINGHKEIAELLIAKGTDVNARHIDGWTPLHSANNEVVELLIAKSANVNAKAEEGLNPLHCAVL